MANGRLGLFAFTVLLLLAEVSGLYFLAVHNSSIGDLVTDSLTQSLTDFYF